MLRKIVVILVLIMLTGCSTLGLRRPVATNDLQNIHHIGVVSVLGDTFHGVHIGTTVFTNKSFDGEADWKMDQFTEDYIIEQLSKNEKYQVKELQLKSDVDQLYSSNGLGLKHKKLWQDIGGSDVDTAIVIRRTGYDNAPFHKSPYGLWERSAFGFVRRCVYSLFIVEVHNLNPSKELAWEWGFPCENGNSLVPWKNSFEEYTNKEKQQMKYEVELTIKNSIDKALKRLRLLQ